MAMSQASRHISELHQLWQSQPSATSAGQLLAAVNQILDRELSKLAVKTGTNSAQLRTQILKSLDGDILRLCAGLSEEWMIHDAIKAELDALALPEANQSAREADNAKLALLLREYRTSGQRKQETNALAEALHPRMLKLAASLALCYGLPLETAAEAVQEVFAKWQKQGGILAGWSESGGASVTTWVHRALQNALRNLRDKEANQQKWLQADQGGTEGSDKPETDLIHQLKDSNAKSASSLLRVDQLSNVVGQLAREMVGKTVLVTDSEGNKTHTLLTENHRKTLEALVKTGDLTDQELGNALGIPKATVGRWKLAVYAYIQVHPRREDIMEMLKPVGSWY